MSTELVALKHATETSVVVFYRGLSNGALTVECNGQTFTGDTIDTAVSDGTGIVTVTGLSAGQSYPYTLKLAGVTKYSGTLKTMPAAGSTFTFGFGGCYKWKRPAPNSALLDRFGDQLAGFCFGGDFPYLDDVLNSSVTMNGESIINLGYAMIADPTDEAVAKSNIYAHHRFYWNIDGAKDTLRSVPCYFIPSDHDIGPGDNWNRTIAKANVQNTWATLQSHVDNMDIWCQDSLRKVYWRGNPPNDSANNDSRYTADEQLYYSIEVGDCTFIFLDHVTNTSGVEFLLGAGQLQWVKDVLTASTKPFKVIFSGNSIGEDTTELYYSTSEWKDIHDHINGTGITGVLVMISDIHQPGIFEADGITHVRASSAGSPYHSGTPDGYVYATYKWMGYASSTATPPDIMHVTGYVTVHGAEYVEFGILTKYGDDLVRPGRVYAESNEVVYQQMRFG